MLLGIFVHKNFETEQNLFCNFLDTLYTEYSIYSYYINRKIEKYYIIRKIVFCTLLNSSIDYFVMKKCGNVQNNV